MSPEFQGEEFPGGPVVRTPCFHCREHRSNPWSVNYNPANCDVWPKASLSVDLSVQPPSSGGPALTEYHEEVSWEEL